MKLRITIKLDNEAFHDSESGKRNPEPEVGRILTEYFVTHGCRIEFASGETLNLYDLNGNHVGEARVYR